MDVIKNYNEIKSLLRKFYKKLPKRWYVPVLVSFFLISIIILQLRSANVGKLSDFQMHQSLLSSKPVVDLDAEELESVIKELLYADSVVLYTEPLAADIDHDAADEIIVAVFVSGGRYPLANGLTQAIDPTGSTDLLVLKNTNGEIIIAAYARNISIISSSPHIYIGDLFIDENKAIIVSSYNIFEENYANNFRIFYKDGINLVPVNYIGGEFATFDSARGFLIDEMLTKNQLTIAYGYHPEIYDVYAWDKENISYVFESTTAKAPNETQQLVIDYIGENLTDIVRSSPILGATVFSNSYYQFYPGGILMTDFSDGHILGVLFVRYEVFANNVIIRHIKEGNYDVAFITRSREELMINVENSESYFASQDTNFPWKKTPADIFLR